MPLTSTTPSLFGLYLSLTPCTSKFEHVTVNLTNSPELNTVAGLFLLSWNRSLNLRADSPSPRRGVSVREGSVRVKWEAMLAKKGDKRKSDCYMALCG